ncbi:MAG: hypothetical protein ISR65_17225 [Bacteriovoracaceae bacterium]|nr:hypothetical protein [Bacteriovoracaceae bacterium]
MILKIIDREFKIDGSLRDIYINNVDKDHWETLLQYIYKREYQISSSINTCPPLEFNALLEIVKRSGIDISFKSKNITINCHFFINSENYSEIEMDFSPKDVQSNKDFIALISLVKELGIILKKNVNVTPENLPESKIISYLCSENKVVYYNEKHESIDITSMLPDTELDQTYR